MPGYSIGIGIDAQPTEDAGGGGAGPGGALDAYLLENGDGILLEDGSSYLLME